MEEAAGSSRGARRSQTPPALRSTASPFLKAPHSAPSYLARMAAGLETELDGADRWAKVGRRIEPDPVWVEAARQRYARFLDYLPFDPGAARPKRG